MTYTLVGQDGRPYESPAPGALGGHRRARIYGRLDCPSALRALTRGGYAPHRVFFPDEPTAVAAGYRPCAVCLPETYRTWRFLADAHTIVIGTSRDAPSLLAGTELAAAWTARGGLVLAHVTWPETAASWLRQARRFADPTPDAWVVLATPGGWEGMATRLTRSTEWSPARTLISRTAAG